MSKKTMMFVVGGIALIGLWALFRPELLFVNKSVDERFPGATTAASNAPVTLAAGQFRSVAHDGRGTATVYRLPDGKLTLRLTNFETSNGPALHVYLVAAADATDNDTVKNAGFLDLGSLKGNQGDQNYDVPAGTDLNKYRTVTIWCQRFGVNFTTAALSANSSAAGGSTQHGVLAEGRFHSVAHESKGVATVHQLANGSRVLRLTEFETSNGPALHVYLVAAPDANDSDTVKNVGFVDLGALKGNRGDQNYEIPATLDLNKYQSVSIWCQRFGVNFATAPLARKAARQVPSAPQPNIMSQLNANRIADRACSIPFAWGMENLF